MIAYLSRTGNVKYIVDRLGLPAVKIEDGLRMQEPFFVFTYTDGLGQVPQAVRAFMAANFKLCRGVIASGNSNFGDGTGSNLFCKSADELSSVFRIPVIRKIDLRGYEEDYEHIRQKYKELLKGE